MSSSKGRKERTARAMLAGAAASIGVLKDVKRVLEAQVSAPSGYERMSVDELALDARSYSFGRLSGILEAINVIAENEFVPGRGRGGTSPTMDIREETALYVSTKRACELIGRRPVTMHLWSSKGGSPCKMVIPYTNPSNPQLLLWKVSELRAFLSRYDGDSKLTGIEPRGARAAARLANRLGEQVG